MNWNKIIIYIIIFLSLISIASAQFGTFERDECVRLLQTCQNCTYNNISSITDPDSVIALNQREMTKNGLEYNLTFCNATKNGIYQVHGYGDPDGLQAIWRYDILITPSGEEATPATAFFYIGAIFLLIFFTAASIFGFIRVENIWIRYTLFSTIYLLLMAISFIVWLMTASFITSSPFIVEFMRIIFIILMVGFLPFIFLSFLYVLYLYYKLKFIQRLVDKGVPYDEAERKYKGGSRR